MHAHKVQARETHASEMHARETPAHEMHTREMYTREIYAHHSVAFLGGHGGAGVVKGAPEPWCLRSPATTKSTRFIKHNEHP